MRELKDSGPRSDGLPPHTQVAETPTNLRVWAEKAKRTFHDLATGADVDAEGQGADAQPCPKRKRMDTASLPAALQERPRQTFTADLCALTPPPKPIEDVLDAYFRLVHPWVPILHPSTFVKRVHSTERSDGVTIILNAIVAVTARHVRKGDKGDTDCPSLVAAECRQRAIAAAIESNAVESLQALLLIAFDTVSSLCYVERSNEAEI